MRRPNQLWGGGHPDQEAVRLALANDTPDRAIGIQFKISHVTYGHAKPPGPKIQLPQPVQVMDHARTGNIVKYMYLRIRLRQQVMRKIRTHKPRASKNQRRTDVLPSHQYSSLQHLALST